MRVSVKRSPGGEMQDYEIETVQGESVLNVLERISETHDAMLAFGGGCGRGKCGICGIKINGREALACTELARGDLILEPRSKGKLMKDLLVVGESEGVGVDV